MADATHATEETAFIEWFKTNYAEQLIELEEDRTQVWNTFKQDMMKYGGVGFILGLATGFLYEPFWLFLIGGLLLGLGISYYVNSGPVKDFKQAYKKAVAAPVVQYLVDSFEYFPGSFVSEQEVFDSELIQKRIDRIRGSDYVEGQYEGREFYFSEIRLETRKRTNKNDKNEYDSIYSGLFYVGNLTHPVEASTVLYPEKSWDILDINFSGDKESNLEKVKNTMYDLKLPGWSPSHTDIKGSVRELAIDDEEIAESYHLYSNNPEATKDLISNEIWSVLKSYIKPSEQDTWKEVGESLQSKLGVEAKSDGNPLAIRIPRLCLSILNKKVYIAQPLAKDLFEPSIWKTNLDIAELVEYFRFVKFAIHITAQIEAKTASLN